MIDFLDPLIRFAQRLRQQGLLGDVGLGAIVYALMQVVEQVTSAVTINHTLSLVLAAGIAAVSSAFGIFPTDRTNGTD